MSASTPGATQMSRSRAALRCTMEVTRISSGVLDPLKRLTTRQVNTSPTCNRRPYWQEPWYMGVGATSRSCGTSIAATTLGDAGGADASAGAGCNADEGDHRGFRK